MSSVAPKNILIFDTETTGLISKHLTIDEYPRIIQLGFIIYDMETKSITQMYDAYINVGPDVIVSNKITEITGITHEMCDSQGIPIEQALTHFYNAYMKCDLIVAHNIKFDKDIIVSEMLRNKDKLNHIPDAQHLFNDTFIRANNVRLYCTLASTKKYCNIMSMGPYGEYLKFPTLTELHEKLFNFTPIDMHNAMVDCIVCLKCYLKYEHQIELPLTHPKYSLRTGVVP